MRAAKVHTVHQYDHMSEIFFIALKKCQKEEINVQSVRKVYFTTYSQADVEWFPTRDSFVQAVLYAFHDSPANIIQWCCFMEVNSKSSGFHFHMAIKLDKNQRWHFCSFLRNSK